MSYALSTEPKTELMLNGKDLDPTADQIQVWRMELIAVGAAITWEMSSRHKRPAISFALPCYSVAILIILWIVLSQSLAIAAAAGWT